MALPSISDPASQKSSSRGSSNGPAGGTRDSPGTSRRRSRDLQKGPLCSLQTESISCRLLIIFFTHSPPWPFFPPPNKGKISRPLILIKDRRMRPPNTCDFRVPSACAFNAGSLWSSRCGGSIGRAVGLDQATKDAETVCPFRRSNPDQG